MTYIPIRDRRGRDCGVIAITANGDFWYYEREGAVPRNVDGTARHLLPVTPERALEAVAATLGEFVGLARAAAIVARAALASRSA